MSQRDDSLLGSSDQVKADNDYGQRRILFQPWLETRFAWLLIARHRTLQHFLSAALRFAIRDVQLSLLVDNQ